MAKLMSALQVALRDELRDLSVAQRVCPVSTGLAAAAVLVYPVGTEAGFLAESIEIHAAIESVLPASATAVERAIALGAAMVLALEMRPRPLSDA